jgi:hypothetical protein
MADRAAVPHAAAATASTKRANSAFGEIDPITQTKFWPRIKREREEHAAHMGKLQAAHRAIRKRCARLEADGGAGDAAKARRLLRGLLKTVHQDRATGDALDPHSLCADVSRVLRVLGEETG